MKKIVVAGGSGKAGRAVVADLLAHGYEVLSVDIAPPQERLSRFLKADLTDLGQTFQALADAQAVVHLAACVVRAYGAALHGDKRRSAFQIQPIHFISC